jgi:hypothetical protein
VATLFKHIQDPVPFEGPVAGRIPLPAVKVLRQALAKDRAERFENAAALAEALRDAQRATASGEAPDAAPTARIPVVAPGGPATPVPTPERRKVTRLDIFVNFVLRRKGTLGTVLQEERTIAENMGKLGARVMTALPSVKPGDVVYLEEVPGGMVEREPFKTRAEVKGTYVGTDGIRRLNLYFLDSPAPDYLVHVDEDAPKS